MRLTIVIIGALCRLTFDVTGHGEYWLFSTVDGLHIVVEASGHVRAPCHVAVTLPATDLVRMFFTEFDAEDGSNLAAESSWKWEPCASTISDWHCEVQVLLSAPLNSPEKP